MDEPKSSRPKFEEGIRIEGQRDLVQLLEARYDVRLVRCYGRHEVDKELLYVLGCDIAEELEVLEVITLTTDMAKHCWEILTGLHPLYDELFDKTLNLYSIFPQCLSGG